ncbi:hypothetical protein RRF57_003871 [Xylaria bambusicola]|uniref:Uncharacterized protein n=1 Tax=Xylaria bambusicola TaxID=326684 RepID=A0AAN7UL00_9PEZI
MDDMESYLRRDVTRGDKARLYHITLESPKIRVSEGTFDRRGKHPAKDIHSLSKPIATPVTNGRKLKRKPDVVGTSGSDFNKVGWSKYNYLLLGA